MSNKSSLKHLLFACGFTLAAGQAWAAPCVLPPASPQQIAAFLASPQTIFTEAASDMTAIEVATRDLAGTDPSLATKLVALAVEARPQQQTAIAAGLAQAALACSTKDQNASQQIQEAVAAMPDGQFQAAFAAVAGDVATAAISAAAALGSVGSVIIVNPATGAASPTPTGVVTRRTPAPAFGVAGPSVTTTGRLAAEAVSPTQ